MSEPTDLWLDPEREPSVIARIASIELVETKKAITFGEDEEKVWLCHLARTLLDMRARTRADVTRMAEELRAYEAGQGILGATLPPKP